MSTNHTTNYDLCQWEATDQVLRTDFNEDNAKLEAALSSLEERVAELYRAVPRVAYNAYNLALRSYHEGKFVGQKENMIFDVFNESSYFTSSTGSVSISNNALRISGQGSTGSVTTLDYKVGSWTRAFAWVRCENGGVSLSLNGVPMNPSGASTATSLYGEECSELEFTLKQEAGASFVAVTIALECLGTSNAVYDYGVVFL